MGRDRPTRSFLFGNPPNHIDFALKVAGETVYADNRAYSMCPHILNLLAKIRRAFAHIIGILQQHRLWQRSAGNNPVPACMRLQRPHRRHQHRRVRAQPAVAALYIEKLFGADIRAEAGLRNQIVRRLDTDQIGQYRTIAVRNVGERAGMDQRRRVLQRLENIRLDCLLHQYRHRSRCPQLLGSNRLALPISADRHSTEARTHIGQARRQCQNRHHFRRRSNVEACLSLRPVGLWAKAADDIAQTPVVYVHYPPPHDTVGVNLQRVSLVNVRIYHRCQKVVRRRHRVHVAGHVQIELFHWHNLAVAAARGAALDSEGRALARLAYRHRRRLANVVHPLSQADRSCRFALAQGCWRNRGHQDVTCVRAISQPFNGLQPHLCHVVAVQFDVRPAQPHLFRDLPNRPEVGGLGNFKVGRYSTFAHVLAPECLITDVPQRET